MLSRRFASMSVAFAAVLLLAPASVTAAQDEGLKANIIVTMSATARNGTSHWSVRGGAGQKDALKVGETHTGYFYNTANGSGGGGSDNVPIDVARMQAGGGGVIVGRIVGGAVQTHNPDTPPPTPKYDYSWKLDVKPLSIAIDAITFEIQWQRSELRDGAMQPTAGDRRTITLRQGQKHLLDFYRCTPVDAPNANVFLDVEAVPVEDSAFADAALEYDLWLVHQTASGEKLTRHAIVAGRQGELVKFNFAPIPLRLETGAPLDAPSPYRLIAAGDVTGRVKSDGNIEIAFSPKREQRSVGSTVPGLSGTGTKVFTVKPDETTSVALPSGTGFSSFRSDLSASLVNPAPGVSVKGDHVQVTLKPFFEGTTTSILLTVRRIR
jgi:hypothetical protein